MNIPKDPALFKQKIKELIEEVDLILKDSELHKNQKELCYRNNELRSKVLNFFGAMFDDPANEFYTRFSKDFYEIDAVQIMMSDQGIGRSLLHHRLEQFGVARRLLHQFNTVQAFIDEVQKELPTIKTDEGLFFKGQYYDSIFELDKLISGAKKDIRLVDAYINIDLINFLTHKQPAVKVKILTSNYDINKLKLTLTGFNKQFSGLEIKESSAYHDRFLIIDDIDIYHFGASLKDLGNKTFMFSKINDKRIATTFIAEFESEWLAANMLFP